MTEIRRLDRNQAAILSAFTGTLCGTFSDFAEYAQGILGRPIFTHQYPGLADEIREAAREDFLKIHNTGEQL